MPVSIRVAEDQEDELPCRCHIFRKFFSLGIDNKAAERQREFLDLKSAAHVLGKAEKTVYAMVADGRAAGIKVGGRWLVHLPTTLTLVERETIWSACRDCSGESHAARTSQTSRISRTRLVRKKDQQHNTPRHRGAT